MKKEDFKIGARVRVTAGHSKGHEGVIPEQDRYNLTTTCYVLLDSRSIRDAFLFTQLEMVSSPTVADKIKAAKAEAAAAEAELAELVAMPPQVGDVYWNGSNNLTKSTVVAVIGDRLWYDNSNQKAQGFVQPINYFSKLGYERYVP